MKWRIITIVLFTIVLSGQCQVIEGFVKDAKTKNALPYVHIGILYKNMGVISSDNGSFSINLSKAAPTDILVFSTIGYETRRIEVGSIKETTQAIYLEPKIYDLGEVVVKPKKIAITKLGRIKPSKWTTGQSGQKEFGFGAERGLQVVAPNGKNSGCWTHAFI